MSKLLVAVLATLAVTAHAEDNRNFIKFEGVTYNYQSSPNDKSGFNLQLGREVAPGVKLDVKSEFRVEENTEKISNRFEAGAQVEQKIPYVKVGVRSAVGEKFTNGDSYAYWLVEPFVSYDLTSDVSVKGSYRYRDAFDTGNNDQTNTYKVAVEYKYTTNTQFGVSVGKTTGDSEYTALQAAVTYKF